MLTNTLTALNKGITRALRSVNSNLVRGDRCSYSTVTSFVDNDIKKIQNRKPRRVLFNVPGSDERKITKAAGLQLDCVVLDLEDGIAINQKDNARQMIRESLNKINFGSAERCLRMNSVRSGFEKADLDAIAPVFDKLDTIVLPKVETVEDVAFVDNYLSTKGNDNNKRIKILACIESAKAIMNLKEICQAPRVDGLIFGSEDYSADLGVTRTKTGEELLWVRSAIVTHAKAYRLSAIDMVCIHYKDEAQLRLECKQGYNLGYDGKQAIHPNQVSVIYECYRPPEESIAFAKKIVEANVLHQQDGKGAFEVDGKMIDMPMVRWAYIILQKANIKL
jgi:citrate lyase subunit beta-like protein